MCLSEVQQTDPLWESPRISSNLSMEVRMLGHGPRFDLDWMGGFNYQSWLNNTQHLATGNF